MVVLIVDDEPDILAWLSQSVRSLGFSPLTARSGEEALKVLGEHEVGFLLTDFMMPGMNGKELLQKVRARFELMPVVVMSAVATTDEAVELLRLGADDFLTKPIRRRVLAERLRAVAEKARVFEEARLFRRFVQGAGDHLAGEAIITRSPALLELLRRLPAIARGEAAVLVSGPSGSGKELVARAIHRLSRRAEAPLVSVSCGAIPDPLFESTLFGHKKGAFTGADRDAPGVARSAQGGTLLFDEVADLSSAAQVKLLRFLETKEVTPLGDTRPAPVDVRVLATTKVDLTAAIGQKRFREDLYYRLNVLGLQLPGLGERREDIPVLANHFLLRHAPAYGSPAQAFSKEAGEALVRRDWPGNVRELENVVQRALVACEGPVIGLEHLQLPSQAERSPAPVLPFQEAKRAAVDAFERRYLGSLLDGSPRMSDAAVSAGIDRKGLWRLLKKHGIKGKG